jgi:hypothetical protein
MFHFIHFIAMIPLFAHADGGGPFDPDRHARPYCDTNSLNRCIDGHHHAADDAHARATAFDPKIQATNDEIIRVNDDIKQRAGNLQSLQAEVSLSEKEIEFTKQEPASAAKEIFSGFPPLEEVFGLGTLDRFWTDHYISERASKLSEEHGNASEALKSENAALVSKQQELASLSLNLSSLQEAKNAALGEAGQHEGMWQRGGCANAICPYWHP